MTFDEALNELEPRTIWSSEMRDLLEQLRATYAPTIEMTNDEKQLFDSWLKEDDFDTPFSGFLHRIGELGGYEDRGLFLELSEKDLMQAWLHPECVKVVD